MPTTSTTADRAADRDAQVAALHQQVTDGVAALTTSEAWRAMLDTAARFHRYSFGNLLLIGQQAPHATQVAGYRTWKRLGRQVRKGERGIVILAPVVARPRKAKNGPQGAEDGAGDPKPVAEAPSAPEGPAGPRDGARRGGSVRGFRPARVFDVSQTDGEPLPTLGPDVLTGSSPDGLWEALAAQVSAHGYTLERGDCAGGADGSTDPTTKRVRVGGHDVDAQAVATLAHEVAHIECGHVEDMPTYRTCRGRCEVEAESVAYVVAAAHGLDTAPTSFAYVAGWAGGELATVRESAETVTRAARRILDAIERDQAPGDEQHQAEAEAEDQTGQVLAA